MACNCNYVMGTRCCELSAPQSKIAGSGPGVGCVVHVDVHGEWWVAAT